MASLAGSQIKDSYVSLLKLDGNTDSTAAGNGSNAVQIKTGDNDATPLYLNTDRLGLGGQPDVNFHIKLADTANVRIEDTSSDGIAKLDFKNDARQATIGVYGDDSDNFKIDHGGGTVLTINTAQYVGIGLTDPNNHLMVGGSTSGGGDIAVANTDTTISDGNSLGSILFKGKDDSASSYGIGAKIVATCTEDWNEATSEGTSLNFYTTDNGSATTDLRMIIDQNGEVFFGESAQGLSISGLTSGKGTITGINQALSAYKGLVFNATDHSFKISGTEKVVINSTGIGIGISSPGNILEIQGATGTDGTVHSPMFIELHDKGTAVSNVSDAIGGLIFTTDDTDGVGAGVARAGMEFYNNGSAGYTTKTILFSEGASGRVNNITLQRDTVTFNAGSDVFKLDSNTRISLSNNDNNTDNTVFGKSAFNASSDNGSDRNVAFGGGAMGTGTVSGAANNTAVGYLALTDITSAGRNVAIGGSASASITSGDRNTAVGADALGTSTTGLRNVAIGNLAMYASPASVAVADCVAIGYYALGNSTHTTGVNGTVAIGKESLLSLTSGPQNTAIGYQSADGLTTGGYNTFVGYQTADGGTITGDENTAMGVTALQALTSGGQNTAIGVRAGLAMATGSANVFIGKDAGDSATACSNVIAIGHNAMHTVSDSTAVNGTIAIGESALDALTSGAKNVAIGYKAGEAFNGANSTIIGYEAGLDADGGATDSTLIGMEAGKHLDDATYNTAIGIEAMKSTGTGNTAIRNTAIGWRAGDLIETGSDNVVIGHGAEVSANNAVNQIAIGKEAEGVSDNSVTLGNVDVTDVYMASDKGATVHANYVLSQGNQNHVANTMSSPYYRFDGTDDVIDCGTNFDLSSGDFSISAWIYHDQSNTSHGGIVGIRDGSGTEVQLYVNTSNQLTSWNGSGNVNTTTLIPDKKWSHVAMVQSGTSKLFYINGILDSTQTQAKGSASSVSLKIGYTGNGSEYFMGSIAGVQIWNKAVDSTEVKELYSGASVPFKYKGASQTASYTSDFSSGVDSWASVRSTADGNIDSIGGQNDTLRVTIDGSSGTDHYVRRAGSGMTVGKSYRAKFDYYIPSGNSVVDQISVAGAGNEITIQYLGTTDSWVTKTIDFDNPYNTAVQDFPIIFSGATGGSNTLSGTSAQNDVFYIKNFTFTPIGAVAEYDGSGIASDKWFDKSGNDLHGTITAGATAPTVENAPSGDDGLIYDSGTWTPAFDNLTEGNATISGFYKRIGDLVYVQGEIVWGSSTSASGTTAINNLPFTISNDIEPFGNAYITDSGTASYFGKVQGTVNSTTLLLQEQNSGGSGNPVSAGSITEASPFTWTTNDVFKFEITYRTA